MEAWQQSEKSIKGAAVCRKSLTRCPTVKVELYWLWQELVWDGNLLKSRNPFRHVPRGGDLMSLSLSLTLNCNSFWFSVLIRLTESLPAHLHISTKKKKKRWSFLMKHQHPHHRIQHPREYHSLLVTATAVWHLIGNLKWNLLLPSEATSSSFSLCSGSFPSFSLGLDVSNLPLRNPQQRNKWFR